MIDEKENITAGIKYSAIMPLLLACMYFAAVLDLDYGYYTFVRIASLVFLGILCFAYAANAGPLNFPCIAALAVIIVFNPIKPLVLSQTTWRVLDVVAGVTMLAISAYVAVRDIFLRHRAD